MSIIKTLLAFFSAKPISISETVAEMKAFRSKLELGKSQQLELISDCEIEKLNIDDEKEKRIKEIEADAKAAEKVENGKIEEAEAAIEEADEWLNMLPKSK